jgi:hypothetical protein
MRKIFQLFDEDYFEVSWDDIKNGEFYWIEEPDGTVVAKDVQAIGGTMNDEDGVRCLMVSDCAYHDGSIELDEFLPLSDEECDTVLDALIDGTLEILQTTINEVMDEWKKEK